MVRVRVNNKVVMMVFAPGGVSGNEYHELDSQGRPTSSHDFPDHISLHRDDSFLVNGNHYKTGKCVDEPCTWAECDRCNHGKNEQTEANDANGAEG